MNLIKNLTLPFLLFIVIIFLSTVKTYPGDKSAAQGDSVQARILTYIYLGETDNDFFIPCRIEAGEVFPEMLLDAISKTGKRFTVKIDKIEKRVFTDEFIPSAKTGDSVCLRAKLHSGNASGFNHEEYVLVIPGAPYFDAIKK